MKAIFLVRDLPNATTNGYRKRNFYLVKELRRKNIDVVLFREDKSIASDYKENKFISAFLSLFSMLPYSVKMRYIQTLKTKIQNYITNNSVDAIICDSIYRALNMPLNFNGKKILFEHNIESMIFKRYANIEKNIFKKLFAYVEYLKLEVFQKKIWKKFDICIVCSELDKKILQNESGQKNVLVINNGVDTSYFKPNIQYQIPNTNEFSILYTGQISWYPNEDAIIHFVKNIYPLIKEKNQHVKFYIVGDKPSSRIKALPETDNSIVVTGFVDDVREYMNKASVFVVPLRIGGGTRLKILEALSMGKAVVSTSIGCEGLDLENKKHLLIKDNPKEFADAVLDLLKREDLRIFLGNNGHRLIEEKYDWNVVFKDFEKVLA